MKSVGEAMAIGRTFKEALQKGIRSLEVKRFGFGLDKYDKWLNAQKAAEKSGTGGRPCLPRKKLGQAAQATGLPRRHEPTTRAQTTATRPRRANPSTRNGRSPKANSRRKLAVAEPGTGCITSGMR